jgi:hypothetical protein
MRRNFILFIFTLVTSTVFAQETLKKSHVYLQTGSSFPGVIESLPEAGKIKCNTEDGGIRTYQRDRFILAFNNFGRFLIVESIPNTPDAAQNVISNFYKNTSLPENDIIFKAMPFEIIPCTISYNQEAINYKTLDGKSASINRENVLVVIRKDGSHEVVRDASEVTPILADNLEKFNSLLIKSEPKPEPPIKQEVISKPEPTVKVEDPKPPIKVEPLPYKDTSTKPKLTSAEKEYYSKQSIDNIITFKDYLNIIGNNEKSLGEKKAAIKLALDLFSPGAMIEVTSKNRPGVRRLPVEVYLKNLSGLSYRSINIEYANLKFISELSQADDGNYYGLVRGEQTFMGYGGNGKPLYSDVVEKNYKVKVESQLKEVDTIKQVKWKVLLGDVSVNQQ